MLLSTTCRVLPPRPRRVLTASMFFSPPKTFNLSPYAEGLAQVFSNAPSPIRHQCRPYNPNVTAFIDLEAQQVEDRLAASEGSSNPSVGVCFAVCAVSRRLIFLPTHSCVWIGFCVVFTFYTIYDLDFPLFYS